MSLQQIFKEVKEVIEDVEVREVIEVFRYCNLIRDVHGSVTCISESDILQRRTTVHLYNLLTEFRCCPNNAPLLIEIFAAQWGMGRITRGSIPVFYLPGRHSGINIRIQHIIVNEYPFEPI